MLSCYDLNISINREWSSLLYNSKKENIMETYKLSGFRDTRNPKPNIKTKKCGERDGSYDASRICKISSLYGSRIYFKYNTGPDRICRRDALHPADHPPLRTRYGQSGHKCHLLARMRSAHGAEPQIY